MASLQHLAHLEATKIAQGRGADPDPYEFERPLERQNRMSRSLDRISVLDTSIPMFPVSNVGKVDVTDAWGMSWAMDSPYDASIAYAKNPAKMASRQSTYFAHPGFDPTFMDGHNSNGGLLGQNEQASTSSPALSGSSTATTIDAGLTWSEASSASSAASSAYIHSSSSGGSITPPASASHASGSGSKDKRRSVSFHGDLAAVADGRKSPAARSWHERPRSEIGSDRPEMVRSRSAQPHARASTLQPSLLGNSRRMTTYSVRGTDTQSLKSLSQSMDLPPIPVDPKILAKKEKRMSKAVFPSSPSSSGMDRRSSVYSPALSTRKSMDNVSLASNGSRVVGGNASKRKSLTGWLSRSTSSNNQQEFLASPVDGNGKQIKGRPVSTMGLTSHEPTNAARNFIPPVPPLPLHATRSASSSASGTPLTSPGLPLTPESTTPSSANGLSPAPTPGKPHSNNGSGRTTPNSSAPPLSNSASYNNSNNSISNSRSTGNITNSSNSSSGTNLLPRLSPAAASIPLAPILSHNSSSSSSGPSGEGVRPASPLAQLASSPSPSSSSLANTANTSVNGYLDVKSVQAPKSPTVVHVNASQPLPQSAHAPRSSSIPANSPSDSASRLKSKKASPSNIQVQLPPGQQMLPTPPHSGTTTPSASSESGVADEEEGNTTLKPTEQQQHQELAPSAPIGHSNATILPSSIDSLKPQPYIPANAASLSSFNPNADRLAALSASSLHSSSLASLQGAPQIPLPPSGSSSFASGLAAIADGIQGQSGSETPVTMPRSSSNKQLVDRIYSLEEGKAPSTPPKDSKHVSTRNRESVISPSSSFHTAQGDNVSISPGATPITADFGMDSINEEGLPRAPSRQSQHQQLKPRASSPNFRSPQPDASFSSETLKVPAKDAARVAHSSAPLATAQPQQTAAANRLALAPQTPRKSKSPFNLFKRSRSKTLSNDDATKRAPTFNKGINTTRKNDGSNKSQQESAPSPTPQLSFSSSTTSRTTTNHSEPSDQFYADFAPRPELSSKNGSAVGSSALKQSTTSAAGNSSNSSKPSYSFASMFGTSGRKKSAKP